MAASTYPGDKSIDELLPPLQDAISNLRFRIADLQASTDAQFVNILSNSTNSTSTYEEDDAGSIAFLLFCTILVLCMTTPGIMLYYSGLVRLQNALSTAIQAYVIMSLISFLWLVVGYSICFGTSSLGGVIGSMDKVWLQGVSEEPYSPLAVRVPEYVFCSFQLSFAIITPSLICGAFANRMKFWAVIAFLSLWHLFVYCPIVHCIWHPEGWLSKWGVQDFAGGCVVHISAGFSALISALMVGQRRRHKLIKTFHPHNKVISAIGASFLCFGWMGFNAGSALHANSIASMALLNTQISCGMASLAWMFIDVLWKGVPTFDGIMNGAIAGLVAITPAAGYVDPTGAFIIGLIGGAITSQGVKIKKFYKFDDALDAFGIHGIAGVAGVALTGLFSKSELSGAASDQQGVFYGGSFMFFIKEIVATLFTICWGCFFTSIILKFVDKVIGLRVSQAKELMGLDASEHGKTSSQMEKVPKLRRNRSNDSLNSNSSGSSASSSDSGSSRGETGNYVQSCWPFSCLGTAPPPSPDKDRDDNLSTHSSVSSNSTLTTENKKIHDSLAANKKVDVSIQLRNMVSKGEDTSSLDGHQHSRSGGGLGKMTRSHSSAKSLSELSAVSVSVDETERIDANQESLPSQDDDTSYDVDQSLQVQQVQIETSSHVLGGGDVQDDDGYFMGCDIEDDSSQESGYDDYDLDSSRRG